METKICTKCGEEKCLDEFFFRNKKTGKRHAQCKDCYNKTRKYKEHYDKHKEEYKGRALKRKSNLVMENQNKMLDFLSKCKCADCGETNPIILEFDHINPQNKAHTIAKMLPTHLWESILVEIEKCEVVCANCHKIRTAKQFNWYRLRSV